MFATAYCSLFRDSVLLFKMFVFHLVCSLAGRHHEQEGMSNAELCSVTDSSYFRSRLVIPLILVMELVASVIEISDLKPYKWLNPRDTW